MVDQTRRLARLRETLASFFPGLERAVDVTNLGDLQLLARHVTPAEIRRAGRRRLTEYLLRAGACGPYAEALVGKRSPPPRLSEPSCPARPGWPSSPASSPPRSSRSGAVSGSWTPRSPRTSTATLTRPSSAACRGRGPP